MRTVLVTGFEPFDRDPVNPSWEAARALDGVEIGGCRVVARQLPCVLRDVRAAMIDAVESTRPDLVIALGLAGGRASVSLERVAINWVDARIPDNAGVQPVDEPVVIDGPAAYFTGLPIKAMAQAVRAAGIPASVSFSAGTYACNAAFYALMHHIAQRRPHVRGGFVHMPYLPAMAVDHPGAPSLSLPDLVEAVRIMVKTAVAAGADIHTVEGTLN
ncbi:MAG: pcp [Rhizobacter sp.]|nr:pcp [Rhizobacter sp.]